MLSGSRRWLGIIAAASALLPSGCSDPDLTLMRNNGSMVRVTVYSGGVAVKSYISASGVTVSSAGACFRDATTGKAIRVAGTIIVEEK